MSSSSSESEDDTRFKQACDPTLSGPYGSQAFLKSCRPIGEIPCPTTLNGHSEETRESLVLARKIQGLLNTKDIKDVVSGINSQRVSYTQNVQSSCRRKKNLCNNDDLPSTLSSYLDKKLTRLLDEKVEIRATNDAAETPHTAEVNDSGLLLLKNKIVKSSINSSSDNVPKKPQKTPIRNLYNKNEVAQRCQNIALSPQFILNMKDVYPWPHPKNIRYIDKYKLKSRKADGSIVAVPLENDHVEVNQLKRKQEKLNRCDQTSNRTGVDVGGEPIEENASVTDRKTQRAMKKPRIIKTDKVHIVKVTNGKDKISFDNSMDTCAIKKRKQSRKRSGKKAKRNSIVSNPL